MKTKNKAILVISVFAAFSLFAISGVQASPGDIEVNETGWWRTDEAFNASSTPIQHAIDNASSDDTIDVHDGTYSENIVVNKELTIKAASNPIIDGQGTLTNPAIHITAANVTVQGFIIQNFICTGADCSSDTGAILVEGDGAKILDNLVRNINCTGTESCGPPPEYICPCGMGIDVTANNVTVTNNTIYNISSQGIRVRARFHQPATQMKNVLVRNNTVNDTGNSGIIVVGNVENITIICNEINGSLGPTPYSLLIAKGPDVGVAPSGVTIENNTIYDGYGNVAIVGASNITISGNKITGAIPHYSDPNTIKGKNIYIRDDCWWGTNNLSTNISITNNDITNAEGYGVMIKYYGTGDPSAMASTTTINCNNIIGNTEYGVENQIATDVNATQNWWGHTSGPFDPSNDTATGGLYNPLGQGDNVSDYVDYDPWSFTPDPCEPKTLGFWKNHEDSVEAILDEYGSIFLGNTSTEYYYEVEDFGNATAVFNNAKNKYALNMLAAQLLAAELNVAHLTHLGIDYCDCIDAVIDDADEFLSEEEYTGPGDTTKVKGSDKQEANGYKNDLDEYNQGLCPC